MNEYINLPIGKINKEKLVPWLLWIGKQKCLFVSFPEIVKIFKEGVSADNDTQAHNYRHYDLVDTKEFVREECLFCVDFKIYELVDCSVRLLVKFFCDGTVDIPNPIYLDDDEQTDLIRMNIESIDAVIQGEQEKESLSWNEFKNLYEEIMEGLYNKELELPTLQGHV